MTVRFTVRSPLGQAAIDRRLRELAGTGPFRVGVLSPLGGDRWSFCLEPARPGIAIGFGKVAEFVVLLSRAIDVTDVGRVPDDDMAAVE